MKFDQKIQDDEQDRLRHVTSQIRQQLEKSRNVADKLKANVVEVQKSMWDHINPTPRDMDDLANIWQYQTDLEREGKKAILLSNRVGKFERMLKNPYFARIDFKEDGCNTIEKIYIGISNLINEESSEILVYDWRAPVSGMFYDYELGKVGYMCPAGKIEGEVLLKRQYRLWNGEIQFMFDSSVAINDDILQEILGKSADSRMKTIVTSIQREQNSVIRNDAHNLLMVYGPAGSGKTSIALHRAAYLLYKYRESITSDNIVILSPNNIFNDYISDVLPELGEENINRTTFFEYAQKTLGSEFKLEDGACQMEYLLKGENDRVIYDQEYQEGVSSQFQEHERDSSLFQARISGIKYKSSEAITKELQHYALYIEESRKFEDVYFNGELIETGEEILHYFIEELKFLPVAKRLEKIGNRLTAKLSILMRRRIEEVVLEIAKTGEYPNAAEIRGRSIFFVRGEAEPAKNSIRDMTELNLLECYKGFFSYESGNECFVRTKTACRDKDICKYTIDALNNKKVYFEDISPLLMLNGLIFGFPNMNGIKHLIIDEVQDYTPIQFELFRLLFKYCHMTLLGDPYQAISPFSSPCSTKAIADILKPDTSIAIQLSKSYRSTRQITEFCKSLIHGENEVNYVNREGELPEVICVSNQEALYTLIAEDIKGLKANGAKSIAVIARTESDCTDVYNNLFGLAELSLITVDKQKFFTGTAVVPSYLSKGLEFDAVLVLCMDPTMYAKQEEAKLVYTVCTRALHKLHIYCLGGFPHFLESIGTEFYKKENG